MHVDAVQNATEDAGFKLPTAEAKQALQAANHLTTWFEQEDVQISSSFTLYLKYFFGIWTSTPSETGVIREQVWTRFSLFVASDEYVHFWSRLYAAAGLKEASLILSFYVTFTMFTDHWINAYPIAAGTSNPQSLSKHLTYDEESACGMSEDT